MSADTFGLLVLYALLINAATYVAFYWDKRQAIERGWRVSEMQLLMLALLGGSPFAKLAQRTMRHKTRKQPFASTLNMIVGVQLVLAATLSLPPVRQGLVAGLSRPMSVDESVDRTGRADRTMPRRFGPGS